MENNRFLIQFKTSANEEDKLAGESIDTTTTIVFKDWTDVDYKTAAAETVKIRQIQPRLRKGERIGSEYIASRPGTRGAIDVEAAYQAKFNSMDEAAQDAEIKRLTEIRRRRIG